MSTTNADRWFVRIRGKVIGPFGLDQLQSLRERGRLLAEHEVSRDRRNWEPAAQLAGLFAPAPVTFDPDAGFALEPEPVAPRASGGASAGATLWHYERDNVEHGPVSWENLKEMAGAGALLAENRVWKRGMPDWAPASEIPGLFASERGATVSRRPAGRRGSDDRARTRMLCDDLLNQLRLAVTADDLDSACRMLIHVGGHALLLAMVAGPGLLIVLAVRSNSLELAAAGVGVMFGLAVLRYVGIRLSDAGHALVRSSPHRLSSTALPDAIALCLLFVGVGTAASSVFFGLRSGSGIVAVIWIALGAQFLAVCSYAAFAALHPDWLNVDCRSEVRAGEEGIGVLAFLLKLWLRFAPVQFGVNAALGAVGLVAALGMSFGGELLQSSALLVGEMAGLFVAAAALIPLLAYLLVALGSVLLDVAQSILAISGADAPADNRARSLLNN